MIEPKGEFGIRKIYCVANRIYDSEYVPEAMRGSIVIVIRKESNTLECCRHRTISIISQLGKVLLRIIMNRLREKNQ